MKDKTYLHNGSFFQYARIHVYAMCMMQIDPNYIGVWMEKKTIEKISV